MPISYKNIVNSFYKDIEKMSLTDSDIIYDKNNIIDQDTSTPIPMSFNDNLNYDDPININTIQDNSICNQNYNIPIINNIINYINNIKNNNFPIIIIDGENLIVGPPNYRSSKVNRIFSKYSNKKNIVVLVVKKSGGTKRFKNYTGVDVPENFIFVSLHSDNKTCPYDGFILELANKFKNSIVVSDDEYINRENFNYGDIYIGTKITTNIGIDGRYIPDIDCINNSRFKRQYITNRNSN